MYFAYLLWPTRTTSRAIVAIVCVATQWTLDQWRLSVDLSGTMLGPIVAWHGYEELPFWIGYFATGVVFGDLIRTGRLRAQATIAISSLFLIPVTAEVLLRSGIDGFGITQFATGTGSFLRPLLIPMVLVLCVAVLSGTALVLSEQSIGIRLARTLSRHALGIYVLQVLVIYIPGRILFPLLQRPLPTSLIAFCMLVFMTLSLSTLGTALIASTRAAFIVGEAQRDTSRSGHS